MRFPCFPSLDEDVGVDSGASGHWEKTFDEVRVNAIDAKKR